MLPFCLSWHFKKKNKKIWLLGVAVTKNSDFVILSARKQSGEYKVKKKFW